MSFADRLRDRDVLVVAEIGNNHEGRLDVAESLVREAAVCGADAVKFQTFETRWFVRPTDVARYQRLSTYELSAADFGRLERVARDAGMLFVSTPLDLPSVAHLRPLVDAYKVASGDNTFYPLLDAVADTRLPVIISSGISDLPLLRQIHRYLHDRWQGMGHAGTLAVLHCVSCYPAPPDQLGLRAIPLLARELGELVGYSDHAIGIQACLTAAALGARIIEKHFTLDHHFSDFRDHQLSADPDELRRLVSGIREVRAMLGDGEKTVRPCEEAMSRAIRRSIVAAGPLPAGHRLTAADLLWMRPGDGLPPGREHDVIGRTLIAAIAMGETILPEHLA